MTFVVADLTDTIAWSLVAGIGVALIHTAITRFNVSSDTLTYSVGTVGCALVGPLIKDGALGIICDMAELWDRRHTDRPELPDDMPISPVIIQTRINPNGGGTWRFYEPPLRKSNEPIPAQHIRAVARQAVQDDFRHFSERHIAGDLRLISGPDFRLFQADLVHRAWATKGAGNKVTIEPAGRAMLAKLATTPLPQTAHGVE
jgi:hypothetical protein